MANKTGIPLKQIAEHIGARIQGDEGLIINGIAPLAEAGSGQLGFLANSKYQNQLSETGASAVIVAEEDLEHCPCAALIVVKPEVAFAHAAELFEKEKPFFQGVHESAVVHPEARVHETACIDALAFVAKGATVEAGAYIGPGCVLMMDCLIKEQARLVANVTIYHDCVVGRRNIIHAGCAVGSDGYGYAKDGERWVKIPQIGRVILGDDVEMGGNVAIDRGAINDTLVADGVKLDNLVHIAHNVQIGENSAITGLVGIAGSAKIGKNVAIGGASAMAGHIEIADNVTFTGMSMITHTIRESGVYSSGMPAEPNRIWRKNVVRFRQLEKLENRIKALEQKLKEMEGS